MRRCCYLFLAALAGCAGDPGDVGEAQLPAPPPHRRGLTELLGSERFCGLAFSADGSQILTASDRDGPFALVAIPFAGGAPHPLARLPDTGLRLLAQLPGERACQLLAAVGGRSRLFRREPTGELVELLPAESARLWFLGLTDDGSDLILAAEDRSSGAVGLSTLEPTYGERLPLSRDLSDLMPFAVTPDRRWLAGWQRREGGGERLVAVDLAEPGAEPRLLFPDGAAVEPLALSPRGDALLVALATAGGERQVELVRLADGERSRLTVLPGPVLRAELAAGGSWLFVEWLDGGRRRLFAQQGGVAPSELPAPTGTRPVAATASPDGRRLAYAIEGPGEVRDLMAFDVVSGEARPLTYAASPRLDPEDLPDPEPLPIADSGDDIVAWRYATSRGPRPPAAPALVWIDDDLRTEPARLHSGLLRYLAGAGHPIVRLQLTGGVRPRSPAEHALALAERAPVVLQAARRLAAAPSGAGAPVAVVGVGSGADLALATLALRTRELAGGAILFGLLGAEAPIWAPAPAAQDGRTRRPLPSAPQQERRATAGPLAKARGIAPTPSPIGLSVALTDWLPRLPRIHVPLLLIAGAEDARQAPTAAGDLVAALAAQGVPAEALVLPGVAEELATRRDTAAVTQALIEFLTRLVPPAAPPTP